MAPPKRGPRAFGDAGEAAALNFLRKRGLEIIETNYRTRLGEIDIVAKDLDTYVFVEVKARSTPYFGSGLEAVDEKKMKRIVQVAREWLHENGLSDVPVRFDVVSMTRTQGGRLGVELVQGAFEEEWQP